MSTTLFILTLFVLLAALVTAVSYIVWLSAQEKKQQSLPTHQPLRDPNYQPSDDLPEWLFAVDWNHGKELHDDMPLDLDATMEWLMELSENQNNAE
ncbi:MAG: hypothetical protein GY943_08215 [Chloroflexi bacterium]|nr:hypothetical protein [Chloroflexota bacterium]